MSKITVDLHDIYNKGKLIEARLNEAFAEGVEKGIHEIVIIHGKGGGQLKKMVIRFLQSPEVKKLYRRIDKDSKNFGKIHVYL